MTRKTHIGLQDAAARAGGKLVGGEQAARSSRGVAVADRVIPRWDMCWPAVHLAGRPRAQSAGSRSKAGDHLEDRGIQIRHQLLEMLAVDRGHASGSHSAAPIGTAAPL
jgi:hypothetical protein